MPITITIGDENKKDELSPSAEKEAKGVPVTVKLDIRKAIDGSLMIFDHPEMDMVVVPATNKIVTFPKESYTDEVYGAQDRVFKHLMHAGLVTPGTVEGGPVHGAMGAVILPPKNPKFPVADLVVLSLAKFIENEKPNYLFTKAYEQEVEDMYVDPDDEDSTPLGKVPQAVKKGTIQPYDTRRYLSGYS